MVLEHLTEEQWQKVFEAVERFTDVARDLDLNYLEVAAVAAFLMHDVAYHYFRERNIPSAMGLAGLLSGLPLDLMPKLAKADEYGRAFGPLFSSLGGDSDGE